MEVDHRPVDHREPLTLLHYNVDYEYSSELLRGNFSSINSIQNRNEVLQTNRI